MSPNENTPFEYDKDIYDKPIKAKPTPPREIGIDTENNFYHNIVDAYQVSQLNLSAIDAFTRVAQTREEVYSLLDTMTEDSIVATALSIYAADATEYNDQGRIVWCESSNDSAAKYVTFLLDTFNVDKYVYKWVYNLCKYGDVYLRLYRESESEDPIFGNKDKKTLQEDVNIKAFKDNDKYIHYVEMIKNPAEMFELTRMGKTVGYIQAKVPVNQFKTDTLTNSLFRYNINRGDVDVYQATEFVHATLDDVSNRTTEEVDIFSEDSENPSAKYTVKRGQSLLYNLFKVWREKMLLENSIMLNRVTKSSITRLLQIEVGDMPKEQVTKTMSRVKTLIEQKSALNLNQSMTEYTNPGPIENTVYMPTHNGVGAITMQTVGGDVDVKGLADLDHIMNQFYGALGIPKQFLGDVDDAGGFSGGASLAQISARYAKTVKRLQNSICMMITDLINLMLINKGLDNYVNNFTIRMQAPATQEEINRMDNKQKQLSNISDIMNLVGDIQDDSIKLKILKNLLSTVITDPEVISYVQDEIDRIESSVEDGKEEAANNDEEPEEVNIDIDNHMPSSHVDSEPSFSLERTQEEEPVKVDSSEETVLPSPADLGMDFTDLDNM